ncbi:MAG TPA: hypothetical protein VK808_11490 [Bacteroidia bacterium]|jgi:hypothetical protein|nr:hypothetical protein [Bacteroidia bacterium]
MKKFIIGSLVGTVLIFVWSFLSWEMLPIHVHSFNYTPKQDSVMKMLDRALPASGAYMLPTADNRKVESVTSDYKKAMDQNMKDMAGKSSAIIFYTKQTPGMDPMQIVRGLLIDLFAVMSAAIILLLAEDKLRTFFMRFWVILLIGFIVALNSYLLDWNWMGFPWHFIKRQLVDICVEWSLVGLWLAWYLKPAKG